MCRPCCALKMTLSFLACSSHPSPSMPCAFPCPVSLLSLRAAGAQCVCAAVSLRSAALSSAALMFFIGHLLRAGAGRSCAGLGGSWCSCPSHRSGHCRYHGCRGCAFTGRCRVCCALLDTKELSINAEPCRAVENLSQIHLSSTRGGGWEAAVSGQRCPTRSVAEDGASRGPSGAPAPSGPPRAEWGGRCPRRRACSRRPRAGLCVCRELLGCSWSPAPGAAPAPLSAARLRPLAAPAGLCGHSASP